MTDIKPRIENGEPVCSGRDCPLFVSRCGIYSDLRTESVRVLAGETCIPALRQQRDEAMRDRVSVELEYRKTLANEYGEDGDIEGLWDVPRDENDTPILGHQFRLVCMHTYGPDAARRLFPDKETR